MRTTNTLQRFLLLATNDMEKRYIMRHYLSPEIHMEKELQDIIMTSRDMELNLGDEYYDENGDPNEE